MSGKAEEHGKKIIIGLTGNIASGKSTVGKILSQLGAKVVDADQVARQVVEVGTPALQELVIAFGEKILNIDGTLNRKVLGNIVFGNNESLEKLNNITHPRIRDVLSGMFDEFRNQPEPGILVIEAALLFETGLNQLVDQVWFVTAPFSVRVERLMMRNELSYDESIKRIRSQESEETKLHKSDVIIINEGDHEALSCIVSEKYQEIKKN